MRSHCPPGRKLLLLYGWYGNVEDKKANASGTLWRLSCRPSTDNPALENTLTDQILAVMRLAYAPATNRMCVNPPDDVTVGLGFEGR